MAGESTLPCFPLPSRFPERSLISRALPRSIIMGAGMSGLATAIQLQRKYDFTDVVV